MPPARQTSRKMGSSPRPRGGSAPKDPGLREQLARYLDPREVVVLTRERVQEALDDAVERGRMTRSDATDLVAALFERGRSSTDELISQLEAVVTGTPTRIVREVDRARRATGIGSSFPVPRPDHPPAAPGRGRGRRPPPPRVRQGARHHA